MLHVYVMPLALPHDMVTALSDALSRLQKQKTQTEKHGRPKHTQNAKWMFSFKALPLRPLFSLSKEKVSSLRFESLD